MTEPQYDVPSDFDAQVAYQDYRALVAALRAKQAEYSTYADNYRNITDAANTEYFSGRCHAFDVVARELAALLTQHGAETS